MVVVTVFNEGPNELRDTLNSLAENLAALSEETGRDGREGVKWSEVLVMVVCDGLREANPGMLDLGASLGIFDPAMLCDAVDDTEVRLHVFSRTVPLVRHSASAEWFLPLNLTLAVKAKNGGKLNSHLWAFGYYARFVKPTYVFEVDVGTVPGPESLAKIYHSLEANPQLGGCCGEIVAGNAHVWSIVESAQHWEYKMSHVLDKAFESFVGFVSVLPGAFCAYRWTAIRGEPLSAYFMVEENTVKEMGPLVSNMYLAEDRILAHEIVARTDCFWTLHFRANAEALTDVPTTLVQLMKQRRRWLNGSFFAAVHVISHWRIGRTAHSLTRRLALGIQFVHMVLALGSNWLGIGAFFLAQYIIFRGALEDLTYGDVWIYLWSLFYLGLILVQVITHLTTKPNEAATVHFICSSLFGVVALAVMVISVFSAANSAIALSVVLAGSAGMVAYAIVAVLHGEVLAVASTLIQFLLFLPTIVNMFSIHSFCNVHDISWGTREARVAQDALAGATGGEVDDAAVTKAKAKAEAVAKERAEVQVEFSAFRTRLLALWLLSNATFASVVMLWELYEGFAWALGALLLATLTIKVAGSVMYQVERLLKTSMDKVCGRRFRLACCVHKRRRKAQAELEQRIVARAQAAAAARARDSRGRSHGSPGPGRGGGRSGGHGVAAGGGGLHSDGHSDSSSVLRGHAHSPMAAHAMRWYETPTARGPRKALLRQNSLTRADSAAEPSPAGYGYGGRGGGDGGGGFAGGGTFTQTMRSDDGTLSLVYSATNPAKFNFRRHGSSGDGSTLDLGDGRGRRGYRGQHHDMSSSLPRSLASASQTQTHGSGGSGGARDHRDGGDRGAPMGTVGGSMSSTMPSFHTATLARDPSDRALPVVNEYPSTASADTDFDATATGGARAAHRAGAAASSRHGVADAHTGGDDDGGDSGAGCGGSEGDSDGGHQRTKSYKEARPSGLDIDNPVMPSGGTHKAHLPLRRSGSGLDATSTAPLGAIDVDVVLATSGAAYSPDSTISNVFRFGLGSARTGRRSLLAKPKLIKGRPPLSADSPTLLRRLSGGGGSFTRRRSNESIGATAAAAGDSGGTAAPAAGAATAGVAAGAAASPERRLDGIASPPAAGVTTRHESAVDLHTGHPHGHANGTPATGVDTTRPASTAARAVEAGGMPGVDTGSANTGAHASPLTEGGQGELADAAAAFLLDAAAAGSGGGAHSHADAAGSSRRSSAGSADGDSFDSAAHMRTTAPASPGAYPDSEDRLDTTRSVDALSSHGSGRRVADGGAADRAVALGVGSAAVQLEVGGGGDVNDSAGSDAVVSAAAPDDNLNDRAMSSAAAASAAASPPVRVRAVMPPQSGGPTGTPATDADSDADSPSAAVAAAAADAVAAAEVSGAGPAPSGAGAEALSPAASTLETTDSRATTTTTTSTNATTATSADSALSDTTAVADGSSPGNVLSGTVEVDAGMTDTLGSLVDLDGLLHEGARVASQVQGHAGRGRDV